MVWLIRNIVKIKIVGIVNNFEWLPFSHGAFYFSLLNNKYEFINKEPLILYFSDK
jgi:hypothetical protein